MNHFKLLQRLKIRVLFALLKKNCCHFAPSEHVSGIIDKFERKYTLHNNKVIQILCIHIEKQDLADIISQQDDGTCYTAGFTKSSSYVSYCSTPIFHSGGGSGPYPFSPSTYSYLLCPIDLPTRLGSVEEYR